MPSVSHLPTLLLQALQAACFTYVTKRHIVLLYLWPLEEGLVRSRIFVYFDVHFKYFDSFTRCDINTNTAGLALLF